MPTCPLSPRYLPVLCAALLTAGCTVGPDYRMPDLHLPAWFHAAGKEQATARPVVNAGLAAPWWTGFHDKTLDYLIRQALVKNANVQAATARITEARANYQVTSAESYPQVNLTARDQNSRQILFGEQSLYIRQYQAIFDAAWEIDLFGGTRRASEAARDLVQAREADLRAARITLTGDVARNYIEWRSLQQQITLTQQTADARKSLLDIANLKYKAGTGSYFEASQADTLYKSTIAQLPELRRQQAASGYRLSVLLGETPGRLNDELSAQQKNLPLPISLPVLRSPSEIIRNRPDVIAAERQLAASTALQGEAFSGLFPRLSLSGFFGINGARLGSRPTETWGITPAASVPLLDFNRVRGAIKAADARQLQSYQAYRNTVLNAVAEIETALSNVDQTNARVQLLEETLKSAQQSVDIARERYRSGLTNFTEVLDSEQQAYGTRLTLVQARTDLLAYIVSLHKALAL